MWRVITPHTVAQSGREFIGCVESFHTAHCGTVWQRVYRVCGELSHRTLWYSLTEFIGCVESYHTAHCGTVWQRVYRVCGALSHYTMWHSLAENSQHVGLIPNSLFH